MHYASSAVFDLSKENTLFCTYNNKTGMLALYDGAFHMRVLIGKDDPKLLKVALVTHSHFSAKYSEILTSLGWTAKLNAQEQFHLYQDGLRKKQAEGGRLTVPELSALLPGVDSMVKHPISGNPGLVYYIIQQLNDNNNGWNRNDIADWLESLDIDMRF